MNLHLGVWQLVALGAGILWTLSISISILSGTYVVQNEEPVDFFTGEVRTHENVDFARKPLFFSLVQGTWLFAAVSMIVWALGFMPDPIQYGIMYVALGFPLSILVVFVLCQKSTSETHLLDLDQRELERLRDKQIHENTINRSDNDD